MADNIVSGTVLDDSVRLSLTQVCRVCRVERAWVIELISQGVVEVERRNEDEWVFDALALRRLRVASRLQRDLGVNSAGAALAIDLMEQLERLRAELSRFPRQ